MDRDKPLWEFVFVEGVNNIDQVPKGSVALISKIHHAGFDGKSGADLMSLLYDISPNPRPAPNVQAMPDARITTTTTTTPGDRGRSVAA